MTKNTNFDLTSPNNILYKFNSVNGGIIVPRGCSVVGSDLRRTKIIPKYVPYPTINASLGITGANEPAASAIFRLTGGGTYFWQMSFFDGDNNGVYYRGDVADTIAPNFSHHKITCFEYATTTDLDLYYQKISKAYATIPDTSGTIAQDQLQARVEENRIVGPISDEFESLKLFVMDKQQQHLQSIFKITLSITVSLLVSLLISQGLLDQLRQTPTYTTDHSS